MLGRLPLARVRSLVLVSALLLASLAAAPAGATAPLVADAGDSRIAYNGEPLALAGRALGGVAPHRFSWSWDGDPARLDDAGQANASFDTAGLAPQDVVLTLAVTDAAGQVATDTVRHRIEAAPVLVRRDIALRTPGIPDELAGESLDGRPVFFTAPAGLARFVAELTWTDDGPVGYDLDFVTLDPNGNDVSGGQGVTGRKPERVVVADPAAGGWTARILPFLSGPTTATLEVQGFPLGSMPALALGGPYAFGAMDPQLLRASVRGGTGEAVIEWDTDGDGLFEASGAEIASALPVGQHVVRARATDSAGFEVSAQAEVDVREADTILRLRCGGDASTPYWAMEFTSTKGSCWIHGGHHTYFMDDKRFALRNLTGSVFTVEQQLSPPSEHNAEPAGTTPLHLEISVDGITWSKVGHGEYRFLGLDQRQRVEVRAQGQGEPFRFLRVSEPLSAAQGLSGYLDHSTLDVEADVLGVVATPPLAQGSRALTCAADILEDFFLTHPCWFGGIDRWDAASFWHTYFLGDGARLTSVRGEYVVAPWRLDDWMQGNTTANATNVSVFVQTSLDGVHWDDVGYVAGTFGAPTLFDVPLEDKPARFVRLFPEYHARFDQTAQFAPNHHAKGYFLHSGIVVEGLLPS